MGVLFLSLSTVMMTFFLVTLIKRLLELSLTALTAGAIALASS
jgi:hypothetical protein